MTSTSDPTSSDLTPSVDLPAPSPGAETSSAELELDPQLELDTEVEQLTEPTEEPSSKSSEPLPRSSEPLPHSSESLLRSSSTSQDAEPTSTLPDLIPQPPSRHLSSIPSSSASSREELYLRQITSGAKERRARIQKDLGNNTLRRKELGDQPVSGSPILNNHTIDSTMSSNTAGASTPPGNGSITGGFSQVQMDFLSNLLKNKLRDLGPRAGPPGPPGIQGPQGDPGIVEVSFTGSTNFRAQDLGYFYPDAPESFGPGDVLFALKETIYREVYTFIKRIEDYALMAGEDSVKEHLSTCFCGNALTWYLQELSDFTRRALKTMPLSDFTSALATRFKMNIDKALDKLNQETYSLSDARTNREPQHYIQNVILYSQAAGLQDPHSQLMWAWQHLDVELRSMVLMPKEGTTIQDFSEELDTRKDLWVAIDDKKKYRDKSYSNNNLNDKAITCEGGSNSNQ